jgi:hypothetical protein
MKSKTSQYQKKTKKEKKIKKKWKRRIGRLIQKGGKDV